MRVEESLANYMLDVVAATRSHPDVALGGSPRAALGLYRAGQAAALLDGRSYVTPGDVKAIGHDVLRHRIILSYEAEAEGKTSDAIVKTVFDNVPVP